MTRFRLRWGYAAHPLQKPQTMRHPKRHGQLLPQDHRDMMPFRDASIRLGEWTRHPPRLEKRCARTITIDEFSRRPGSLYECRVWSELGSLMLSVFGDESMDATEERVCAVAGVVGTDLGWEDLEARWVERIDRTHRGIPFHAKDCDSDQGDYRIFAHADNKTLYRDLAILVAESHVCGFGQSIDLCCPAAHIS